MLFQSKRKKITQYLAQKKETGWSAFDELLRLSPGPGPPLYLHPLHMTVLDEVGVGGLVVDPDLIVSVPVLDACPADTLQQVPGLLLGCH